MSVKVFVPSVVNAHYAFMWFPPLYCAECGQVMIWYINPSKMEYRGEAVEASGDGFIHTLPSSINPREHDCDHLQVHGSVFDSSTLSGVRIAPVRIPDSWATHYRGSPTAPEFYTWTGQTFDWIPAPFTFSTGEFKVFRFHPNTTLFEGRMWEIPMYSPLPGVVVYMSRPGGFNFEASTNPADLFPRDYRITITAILYAPGPKPQDAKKFIGTRYYNLGGLPRTWATFFTYVFPIMESLGRSQFWDPCASPTVAVCSKMVNSLTTASIQLLRATREISRNLSKRVLSLSQCPITFGEAHYLALCKVDGFSGNGFAYIRDMKNILSEMKSLWDLLQGDVTPKAISSLYLTFRYGLPLTVSDTKQLVSEIAKVKNRKTGVSATLPVTSGIFSGTMTSTIRYHTSNDVISKLYEMARYLDILPTAENIWDLIPYSFVVDWFVNVGDTLDQIDKLNLVSHLTVDAVFDSAKLSYSGPASLVSSSLVGDITITRYQRKGHLDASFPLIVTKSRNLVSHWVDGLALIIQRLK